MKEFLIRDLESGKVFKVLTDSENKALLKAVEYLVETGTSISSIVDSLDLEMINVTDCELYD